MDPSVPEGAKSEIGRQKREDTVLATFEIMVAILFGVLPLALLGGHGPTWATATACGWLCLVYAVMGWQLGDMVTAEYVRRAQPHQTADRLGVHRAVGVTANWTLVPLAAAALAVLVGAPVLAGVHALVA